MVETQFERASKLKQRDIVTSRVENDVYAISNNRQYTLTEDPTIFPAEERTRLRGNVLFSIVNDKRQEIKVPYIAFTF